MFFLLFHLKSLSPSSKICFIYHWTTQRVINLLKTRRAVQARPFAASLSQLPSIHKRYEVSSSSPPLSMKPQLIGHQQSINNATNPFATMKLNLLLTLLTAASPAPKADDYLEPASVAIVASSVPTTNPILAKSKSYDLIFCAAEVQACISTVRSLSPSSPPRVIVSRLTRL